MKTYLASSLRVVLLAVLFALPAVAATSQATAADRASQLLAMKGRISIAHAGPYVELGTFQIQVITKLGEPTAKLRDGTWLYDGCAIDGSDARGTLVVSFNHGRVADLALVTPTVAMAMQTPTPAREKIFAANAR
jgi:hypothetical protein